MTSSKYFYLEYILLAIINARSRYCVEPFNCGKNINIYSYCTIATPYHTYLVDPACYAVLGAVWLFCVCMLVYQLEIISTCTETTWLCATSSHYDYRQ